jgi:hypothetical protein
VAPLLKAGSELNVSKLAVDPDENFTIFVTVAPLCALVKEVTALLVPCAVVNVTEPAVSDPNVSLAMPSDAATPLIDALLNVALFELTTTLIRV